MSSKERCVARQRQSGPLLTAARRGAASGNKLKMTLGLPVYVLDLPPPRRLTRERQEAQSANCSDNSRAQPVYIISVKRAGRAYRLNRLPAAGVGDMVMPATVKKGKPELRKEGQHAGRRCAAGRSRGAAPTACTCTLRTMPASYVSRRSESGLGWVLMHRGQIVNAKGEMKGSAGHGAGGQGGGGAVAGKFRLWARRRKEIDANRGAAYRQQLRCRRMECGCCIRFSVSRSLFGVRRRIMKLRLVG